MAIRKTEPAPKSVAVPMPKSLPQRKQRPASATKASSRSSASWPVVLSDDFSTANLASPDCPWITGFPWGQTHGDELQYYTRYDKNTQTPCAKGGINHVYTGNGTLRLTAKVEPGNYEVLSWPGGVFTRSCVPYGFTSAMLQSKQRFLYGHFEMRCTIPHAGTKLFPAFWLWAGDPYREIDIFEFEDPGTANNLLMNIHIDRSLDFGRVNPPGKTDSINDYPAQLQISDVNLFHVYAVQWRPNSVTWLVDGVPVRVLAGHSPALGMDLIINLAMAHWRPPPAPADLPAAMEIDYVNVYRITDPEFLFRWGNNGDGKLALWNMHATDRFLAGKFSGGARAELLAIAANAWAHLMRWDGSAWQWAWGNGGANKIALWQMKPDDRYLVGDFFGDGRDGLLAIAANGWAHLMRWDGSAWQWLWGNNGANKIALWNMKPDDRFIVGDFDGDGRDEVLAVAGTNGWAHLMRWGASDWQWIWGNNGDYKVGLWQMSPSDRYLVGDFEGVGRNQLAVLSEHGWAHAMNWTGSEWQWIWGNDGGQTIHLWFMRPDDRYLAGPFEGGKAQILAASANGWVHLLKFEPVP